MNRFKQIENELNKIFGISWLDFARYIKDLKIDASNNSNSIFPIYLLNKTGHLTGKFIMKDIASLIFPINYIEEYYSYE